MSIHRDRTHETAGQGRHRDAAFQRLSSQIMREAHDLRSLELIAQRVMNDSDVRGDAELAAQLRACLGQHDRELRTKMSQQQQESAQAKHKSAPETPPRGPRATPASIQAEVMEREHTLRAFDRLRRMFEEKLLQFDIDAGRRLLAQLSEFQALHRGHLTPASVERCGAELEKAAAHRQELESEIETLAKLAATSAYAGRLDESAKALKRLASIRASRPMLLTEERLESIRKSIENSGERFEHREAGRELVRRERATADELRKLADIIHQFHLLSREIEHGDPRYLHAEKEYLEAVRSVRHHDREWLADLMVELDQVVADLHDPTGRAEAQVERFLHSVKASIVQMVREIREIAQEQASSTTTPRSDQTRPQA